MYFLYTALLYIINNNLFKFFKAIHTNNMCLCCQFQFKQRMTTGALSGI